MVQTYLQLATHPGLVHVLTGTVSLAEALQSADIGSFDVLTAGPMPPNPNELIGSASMRETLRQLKSAYDLVIVDTAPILPVADTLHLSLMVGGVIIVARIGETKRERLRRTKEALERVHANIIGVVPNGVIQREDSAYFYAYTYADRAVQKKKQPVSTGSDTGR
jgi:receptor protein-tyrosine kinase